MNRGEIWLINFDPSTGDEIVKKRPAIIISHNSIGKLKLKIVVPITSWKENYSKIPWFIPLHSNIYNNLKKDSAADTFQIKSLSEDRFIKKIGTISDEELENIVSAINLCIG